MTPYYEHGGITIYHGDCREILSAIQIERDHPLVLTDPPYGISLEEHGRNGYDWSVVGDSSNCTGWWVIDWASAASLPIVVFASPKKPLRGLWKQLLIWDKGPAVGGGGDPGTYWKPTWELIQIRGTGKLSGQRDSAVITEWVTQADYHFHPCQKPTKLLSYLIAKTAHKDQMILDPFCGSGSTLVSAKALGHGAIGVEIEEKYCEIAAKRLSQEVFEFPTPPCSENVTSGVDESAGDVSV